ncbi:hypothetical protein DXX93_17085 [Thalassotalea euphylliae]|uniref:Uncharacterized protein n=2 Tax=Thalassotalea euphylliae TaxID=1655234 RepID=A0A3E0TUR1_9GAMM|nr:hypothetical protein DXX93_17085 [Thalassotalea euphylliae]
MAFVALAVFLGFSFADHSRTDQVWQFASALLLMWSLMLALFIYSFSSQIGASTSNAGLLTRLRLWLLRMIQKLIMWLFFIALLASIFMTFRLLSYGFYQ